jgi:hypothetical protein
MRLVGYLSGDSGKDKVERREFPAEFTPRLGKSPQGALATRQPEDRIPTEHRALETVESRPLGSKGVARDQVSANRNSHRGAPL